MGKMGDVQISFIIIIIDIVILISLCLSSFLCRFTGEIVKYQSVGNYALNLALSVCQS